MKLLRRTLSGLVLALSLGISARATPITTHFSGTITSVPDADALVGTGIAIGTPFQGQFTVDPVGWGGPFPDSTGAQLFHAFAPQGGPGSFHAQIAGLTFDTTFLYVVTSEPGTAPGTVVFVPLTYHPAGVQGDVFEAAVGFEDDPPARPAPTALDVPTSLAGWDQTSFVLFGPAPPGGPSGGHVIAFGALTMVPEPGALALLALALAAAVRRRGQGAASPVSR